MVPSLLIDIGNGRTKLALSTADALNERRETSTRELSTSSLTKALEGWTFDRVVMCSVVPRATGVVREHFGPELIEVRHDTHLGIGIRYPKPASIGPDRLANAVALAGLHARPGQPGMVIDFGTEQGYRGVVLGIRDAKVAQRAQVMAKAALVAKSLVL